ncbi:hypothetical protein V865_008561 [Kwoniella europaea PYCC6329]|uniref:BLOC-1-related complex subunit 7 n=1 Tax=Kwoniella europaea PYCC6329 TaxID=1423913 RepID=A0AAX4KY08_9TREE
MAKSSDSISNPDIDSDLIYNPNLPPHLPEPSDDDSQKTIHRVFSIQDVDCSSILRKDEGVNSQSKESKINVGAREVKGLISSLVRIGTKSSTTKYIVRSDTSQSVFNTVKDSSIKLHERSSEGVKGSIESASKAVGTDRKFDEASDDKPNDE